MPQPPCVLGKWRRKESTLPDAAQAYNQDSAGLLERKQVLEAEIRATGELVQKLARDGTSMPPSLQNKHHQVYIYIYEYRVDVFEP